jgi:hypothetical protein
MPDGVIGVAVTAVALLLGVLLHRSFNSGFAKAYAKQDEYFTPRMKAADQQLQALSKRLGAEYVQGIVEWRSFATPGDLASSEMKQPNSVWGGGSSVRKLTDGYEIEVTYGVQSLVPSDGTGWDVFVPRFTVKRQSSRNPLNRFDLHWSSDSEVQGATGRALDKAVTGALSFLGRQFLPMTPEVERAYQALKANASTVWCGEDRIEATGRAIPRARGETREFGQGDFAVESLTKMIQLTLALVRAVEKG